MIRSAFPGTARHAAVVALVCLLSLGAYAQEAINSREIVKDLDFRHYRVTSPSGTVNVHMVLVDLDAVREGRLVVEPALPFSTVGGSASPESIARQAGALAAINGPYFGMAGGRTYALGFNVLDGRLSHLGALERPLVAIDRDGGFRIEVSHPQAFVTSDVYFEPLWLWNINTPAGQDAVTLYDEKWGETVSGQGGTVVAIAPFDEDESDSVIVVGRDAPHNENWDGRVIAVSDSPSLDIPPGGYALVFRGRRETDAERYGINSRIVVYSYRLPTGWEHMRWIVTLGPWFVHEGRSRDFSNETVYGGNITGRASRSAIGTTWNDEIFFAVTTGASLDVQEAADVLIECNVREAVMCDSGSSAGLWASGVGVRGSARSVPMAFVVGELEEPFDQPGPLSVWINILHRN